MLVVPVFETIIAPDATLLFRTKQLLIMVMFLRL